MVRSLIPVKYEKRDLERELEKLLEEPTVPPNSNTTQKTTNLIDAAPADNGSSRTQDDWIAYFNGRNELMVSMPDLYLAGKSNDQQLLDSLRKDCKESWIITDTKIIYGNKTQAKIIHHYKSNKVTPVEYKFIIPECRPWTLEQALNNPAGLGYLQVLFVTKDTPEQIKETLRRFSNYSLDKIRVWSAALSDRPTERAAGFICSSSEFHVDGDNYILDLGRSRGVKVSPR